MCGVVWCSVVWCGVWCGVLFTTTMLVYQDIKMINIKRATHPSVWYSQSSLLYNAYTLHLYSLQSTVYKILHWTLKKFLLTVNFQYMIYNNNFQLLTENFRLEWVFDKTLMISNLNSQAFIRLFWVSSHNINWDSASNCFILKKFPNKICGGEESFKQKQNRTLSSINVQQSLIIKFATTFLFSIEKYLIC